MEWRRIPKGEGFVADGRDSVYLTTADLKAGAVTGVRLTRWRSQPPQATHDMALEITRNVIILPLPSPVPAGGRDVEELMGEACRLAEKCEAGEMVIPGHPGWR